MSTTAFSLNPPTFDKTFNQLIIIGNGFDLACGLESSYQAFFKNRFKDLELNNYSDYEIFTSDSTKIPHKNVWDLIFLFEKNHSLLRWGEIVEWQDVEKVISRWLAPDGTPSIRTILELLTEIGTDSVKIFPDNNKTKHNKVPSIVSIISNWIQTAPKRNSQTGLIDRSSIETEIFNSFHGSPASRPWRNKERELFADNLWQIDDCWKSWHDDQASMRQTNKSSSEKSVTLPNFHSGNPWIDWYISDPSSQLCRFFLNELKEFEKAFQEYIIANIQEHPSYYLSAKNLYNTISSQYSKDSKSGETRNAILSFNYTTPLPKCISEEQNTYRSRQLWVEQNVHGTLDSSCIFGIDGFDENNKRLEGIPRIFTKSNRQLYLERTGASTYPPNTSRTLFDAIRENGKIHCIKFYGHSLGAADYSYFRTIFNIVDIYNSDVTLYFLYSKNHPTNPEAVENLIDRYNRETLESTSANCDLLQKLLLESRLQLRAIPDPTPDEY